MPPLKVWIFIGCIVTIVLVGLFFWDPDQTKTIPCSTPLHDHGDGVLVCDDGVTPH